MFSDAGKNAGLSAAQAIGATAEHIGAEVTGSVDKATAALQAINETDIAALADLGGQIVALIRSCKEATLTTRVTFVDNALVMVNVLKTPPEVPQS